MFYITADHGMTLTEDQIKYLAMCCKCYVSNALFSVFLGSRMVGNRSNFLEFHMHIISKSKGRVKNNRKLLRD